MPSFSRQLFSGSTNGKPINIAATASPGTLIHTAHATDKDVVYLELCDYGAVDTICTVEIGTTGSYQTFRVKVLKDSGPVVAIEKITLTGSQEVRVFCSAANEVVAFGHVDRITP